MRTVSYRIPTTGIVTGPGASAELWNRSRCLHLSPWAFHGLLPTGKGEQQEALGSDPRGRRTLLRADLDASTP